MLNSFQSINQDGTITEDGLSSPNPAFSVTFDEVNFHTLSKAQNTGDFISEQMQTGIESTVVKEYLSDDFLVSISDENGAEIKKFIISYRSQEKC